MLRYTKIGKGITCEKLREDEMEWMERVMVWKIVNLFDLLVIAEKRMVAREAPKRVAKVLFIFSFLLLMMSSPFYSFEVPVVWWRHSKNLKKKREKGRRRTTSHAYCM